MSFSELFFCRLLVLYADLVMVRHLFPTALSHQMPDCIHDCIDCQQASNRMADTQPAHTVFVCECLSLFFSDSRLTLTFRGSSSPATCCCVAKRQMVTGTKIIWYYTYANYSLAYKVLHQNKPLFLGLICQQQRHMIFPFLCYVWIQLGAN